MSDGGISGMIIAFILGYFVYGSLNGALGSALFALCIGFSCFACVIPVIGVVIFLALVGYEIPIILAFTHLSYTWLNTVIIVWYTCIGLMINLYIISIYYKIKNRNKGW